MRIQQADEVRNYAAHFRPGYWNFAGTGPEKTLSYDKWGVEDPNWNSKASQILNKYKESGHPVVPDTTMFEQGLPRTEKGKESIHFNARLETVSSEPPQYPHRHDEVHG